MDLFSVIFDKRPHCRLLKLHKRSVTNLFNGVKYRTLTEFASESIA